MLPACDGISLHHRLCRAYSNVKTPDMDDWEGPMDMFASTVLGADEDSDVTEKLQDQVQPETVKVRYHVNRPLPQRGSMTRKRQRMSRPASVISSIRTTAQGQYMTAPPGKIDLSYRSPLRFEASGQRRLDKQASSSSKGRATDLQPVSLYSILARYLDHNTSPTPPEYCFRFSPQEVALLRRKGFVKRSIERWAASLLQLKSLPAVSIFEDGSETPPLLMLLLLLRRRHLGAFAFGVILRHVEHRTKTSPFTWSALKLLSVRLLRHARKVWPESIPWIASTFAAKAADLVEAGGGRKHKTISDITQFSNIFLLLLSLPANIYPVLAARYQEEAQFQILQFMAGCTPAITVTRLGFRSVARNQLAHVKTVQEREWAELKGPTWPPWKENRTAMDEDKGFEFGISRTSKILLRMYEAGYRGRMWEEVAELYAGWDTDKSPTIQTRTPLPRFSSQFQNIEYLKNLTWAGRVRTTRTRREAWACFLAYEESGVPAAQEVYLAMFEKLYYPESGRPSKHESQADMDQRMRASKEMATAKTQLLPGDMKEVVPDPTSPLHYVYLSEPVPTIGELCHRMHERSIRPSKHLLAFLLDAASSFDAAIDLLNAATAEFDGAIDKLLSGQHDLHSTVHVMPGYFFAAFVRCLCRFGHFNYPPEQRPEFLPPALHAHRLKHSKQYLLEYAEALLLHYRPLYRPAWTAYMEKVLRSDSLVYQSQEHMSHGRGITKYETIWKLIGSMEQIDLDVDDKMFGIVCTATTYVAQAVNSGTASVSETRHLRLTGSPRLRKLFHALVGANIDTRLPNFISNQEPSGTPPHIPGPAELHAYVRALGMLRDYEGLYSLSGWLTKHHAQVTARAEAQHSGSKLLYRTLVALRASVTGYLDRTDEQQDKVSEELLQLIRHQIESVEAWGGWPSHEDVELYVKGGLKTRAPGVGGR